MSQLPDPRFGMCNLISGIWISSDPASGSTYLGYPRYAQHVVVSWTSAFGFAARKASRHPLHKHVNAHVYLGVWRITLNSVQAVVGDPHDHVDKPFCVAQLSYSQIWEVQIGSCESRYHVIQALKHVFTFTLISCTVKVAFGCGIKPCTCVLHGRIRVGTHLRFGSRGICWRIGVHTCSACSCSWAYRVCARTHYAIQLHTYNCLNTFMYLRNVFVCFVCSFRFAHIFYLQTVCCSKACTRARALLEGVPRSGIPYRA